MKRKKFSASYPADSQLDYSRQANRCRLLPKGSPRYRELGCKREDHIMVEGGREVLRYGGDSPSEGRRTARRLSDELPPWDERTQSAKSLRPRTLERKIAIAIHRYRESHPQENQFGFSVPRAAFLLTDVGMPRSAATILVRRAAGRFYPEAGLRFLPTTILGAVEDALRESDIFAGERGSLRFRGDRLFAVTGKNQRRGEVIDWVVEFGRGKPLVLSQDKITEIAEIPDTGGREYSVARVVKHIRAVSRSRKAKVKRVFLFFSGRKQPLEADLSDGEHSKSLGGRASRKYPEYKSLDVPLRELPSLLARLSRRKKGKKERAQLKLSKENPTMASDNWYYKKQYSKGPYGARRSLPAARRNRSRKNSSSVGSQMASMAMDLHHNHNMSLKEAWKTVKAEARSNGYHRAKKNGGWYFGRRAGGGPKGSNLYLPDRTQTRPALVPHAPWDDGTEVFSALVPGPYAKRNRGKSRRNKSRRNSGHVYVAKNGQPYIKLPNGQARFISKQQAARMNGGSDYWKPYHSQYSEVKGQFSTGLRKTGGTQPYARRNKKRRKSRKRR